MPLKPRAFPSPSGDRFRHVEEANYMLAGAMRGHWWFALPAPAVRAPIRAQGRSRGFGLGRNAGVGQSSVVALIHVRRAGRAMIGRRLAFWRSRRKTVDQSGG